MQSNQIIYGTERMAEHLGVSEATVRRWLKKPEAWCFTVGSMANTGGGYGRGWFGEVSSLEHLKEVMRAQTSELRRNAAQTRWAYCDVSSESNIKL
jgi:hypothetical protein